MVMVYQNLIFPRQCPSLPVLARQCSSLPVIESHSDTESLCDSSVMSVNVSKARKESHSDSARAMLFNASKASQC